MPEALTLSHQALSQTGAGLTGTGFELIITTPLVLCLLHFLGFMSGFSGHSYPSGIGRIGRILYSGSSKPEERFEARTEFLGEGERIKTTEGQSWALASPLEAPQVQLRRSLEAQGLAQGHMPLIPTLFGRGEWGRGEAMVVLL